MLKLIKQKLLKTTRRWSLRNAYSPLSVPEDITYPNSLSSRLLKGMGAYSVGQVLNFTLRILLPPLFLKAWGADVYGEWLVLSSFVAYLSLTDMGGHIYIVNRLSQTYTQQDILLFRKILHTGLALFLLVPLVVFLLFTTIISIVPSEVFLPISNTDHQIAVWVLAILALQFVFSLPQSMLIGIYRAVGLLARGEMISNLIQLLQLILIAGALWLGGGMVLIASLQAAPYLFVAIIAAWELNRRFPQFGLLSFKETKYSTGLTFIKPSLHFLSIQMAQTFSIQGVVLLVGWVLAPLQVVVFTTIRTMVAVMRQGVSLLTHTAWYEMTRLDAQHDIDGLYMLFRAILRSALILAGVLITVFYYFGGAIHHLWLGDELEYQPSIMHLFLVYFFQLVLWTTCSHLLMATNVHRTLSIILLISSVLSLMLAYLGGKYFGLHGVLVGIIAGDLLLPFWYVPYLVGRYQAWFSLPFYTKEIVPIIGGLASLIVFPWVTPVVVVLLFIWWIKSLPDPFFRGRRL